MDIIFGIFFSLMCFLYFFWQNIKFCRKKQIQAINVMLQRRGLPIISAKVMTHYACSRNKLWKQGAPRTGQRSSGNNEITPAAALIAAALFANRAAWRIVQNISTRPRCTNNVNLIALFCALCNTQLSESPFRTKHFYLLALWWPNTTPAAIL